MSKKLTAEEKYVKSAERKLRAFQDRLMNGKLTQRDLAMIAEVFGDVLPDSGTLH